ncbi:type II secretion system protein [Luteolibacter yonseiensis]|uniref:Type II secretion system protein n=1 Tax=Luteolibacter yonseiensis TaxID=1144680 RepID=A0A934RAD8_9BACT|nr:type II secretion system protein [Luteolibacter yonseiensis]MBK1818095.1 type II secretion system protein [Luteolibacter yonseiensis]
MKSSPSSLHRGFTLLETVIAIGVLAVLLTGFMLVFSPAAEGIRKSINVQEADRLASALEQELVTLREGEETTDIATGFDKAFNFIEGSDTAADALLVYQYRGNADPTRVRTDGTPEPVASVKDKIPGKDFIVVSMARKASDNLFSNENTGDISAVEGAVYLVKCTQLVFGNGNNAGLELGDPGKIVDPKDTQNTASSGSTYSDAVIAFAADFYMLPAKNAAFFSGSAFANSFNNMKTPVFTRNLAVRR